MKLIVWNIFKHMVDTYMLSQLDGKLISPRMRNLTFGYDSQVCILKIDFKHYSWNANCYNHQVKWFHQHKKLFCIVFWSPFAIHYYIHGEPNSTSATIQLLSYYKHSFIFILLVDFYFPHILFILYLTLRLLSRKSRVLGKTL